MMTPTEMHKIVDLVLEALDPSVRKWATETAQQVANDTMNREMHYRLTHAIRDMTSKAMAEQVSIVIQPRQ